MLLETQTRPVTSNHVLQTARATIKATPKIFNFFADQTYANKPEAICRELVANAVDAHTAAGNPDPVEVWLPTELDPTFRVRDKGIGMSHEFMMTSFLAYTDGSTKDTSDTMIGGFGIGSKSPFAYTDQFTIRSVHQGTLSIYSMFIDEEGIPAIGLLGQRSTNEPNGIEVSFPVKPEDFGTFANAANEALKYFDPLPLVHGGEIDAPAYVAKGKGWAMRPKAGDLGVIMGGVRYPVSKYNLDYSLRVDEKLSPLLEYGLDLTVPIGTCGVALSREALSYDERTNEGLRKSLDATYDEIVSSFSTMFDHLPTEWDAKLALMEEAPLDQRYSARARLLLDNAKYRGQPLTPEVLFTGTAWIIDAPRRRHSNSVPSARWEYYKDFKFHLQNYDHVIVDDLPQSPKSKTILRIKNYLKDTYRRKSSIILRDVEFDTTIPLDTFILASSLPAPETPKRTKGERPKVRMFRLSDDRNGLSFHPSRYGTREVAHADQPATGVMVVGDNFEIPSISYAYLRSGLIRWDEVVFVNKGDASKLSSFRTIEDLAQERLKDLRAAHPDLPVQLYLRNSSTLSDIIHTTSELKTTDLKSSRRNSPLARILDLRARYLDTFDTHLCSYAQFFERQPPKGVDVNKLKEAFYAKQPLAAHFIESCVSSIKPNTPNHKILQEII